MPEVSVVMPAYNAARTIGAAVSSVLGQTYADFELVVVDDGSTDETAAIAAAHPGPVRVVSQPNKGVAAARNRGIAEAAGELIAFCDADDILFPGHLEALLATWRRQRGVATANAYWLFPDGIHRARTRHKGRFPAVRDQRRAILEQNFVSTMALFPKRLVDDIGPFAEDLRRGEDWHFWMRAVFAGLPIAHQPRPLALYRWTDASLSADRAAMDQSLLEVLRRAYDTLALSEPERDLVRRRLDGPDPRELGRRADEALRNGRYRDAARLYQAAAAMTPSERRLVLKARAMAAAPPLVGPLVRARQLRIDREVGFDERLDR